MTGASAGGSIKNSGAPAADLSQAIARSDSSAAAPSGNTISRAAKRASMHSASAARSSARPSGSTWPTGPA